jgi:4-hydroxyproline epimerase
MQRIQIVDSHTGGEPTRLVTGGFPDLGGGSMAERRALLAERHDKWRAATVLEPRGSDVVVGALLCEPVSPDAAAGVIFFNNAGYLGMCGHGTIGLVASLAHMGRIGVGEHRIETPVGTVTTTLHADGSVSVRNVPAYRHLHQVAVELPGHGTVRGDVAYGGNWFFLVSEHGQRVASDNLAALTDYTAALRKALAAQGITGRGRRGDRSHRALRASRGKRRRRGQPQLRALPRQRLRPLALRHRHQRQDRLPRGRRQARAGRTWTQASVIGSRFEASYAMDGDKVIPTLRGRAHISAEATLLVDDEDPFGWGIRL